jgi:hypothetical protein
MTFLKVNYQSLICNHLCGTQNSPHPNHWYHIKIYTLKEKRKVEKRQSHSDHEAFPSMLCPILLKVPLSTNQMITPTTAVTNAMKKIQKHQQTMVRFFFLLFWRASHESL